MKDYIALASTDELNYICVKIGGKALKELYKHHTKDFNKLKPGFRPEKLSDGDAISFAVNNCNALFVGNFINTWLDSKLKEIKLYYSSQIENKKSETTAYIETLSHSVFDVNPELFFKLSEENPPVMDVPLFCSSIRLAIERDAAIEELNRKRPMDDDDELINIKKEHEAELAKLHEDLEKQINKAQEQENVLRKEIQQLEGSLSALQADHLAANEELQNYRNLASFCVDADDYDPTPGYHYVSLCSCYTDSMGRDRLLRRADIRDSAFSERFLEDAPEYKNLYRKDGPNRTGFFGVWDWTTVPNSADPTRDYIQACFNDRIHPIEVCWVKECQTVENLVSKLKEGIFAELHADRIIFSLNNGINCEGVFCDSKLLEQQSGKVFVKANTVKLPVFIFSKDNLLSFDAVTILSYPRLGIPTRFVHVKNPNEIVLEKIVERVTWNTAQQNGFVKNEYRQIKDFLTSLPTENLYQDLSASCECNIEDARSLVDGLWEQIDTIITGVSIENKVMAQIIRNEPELYQACLDELDLDWRRQNQEMIAEANRELEETKNEAAIRRKECADTEKALTDLERKISEAQTLLSAQEKLASDVESLVNEKIERAKSNAAEFIAEYAFTNACSSQHQVLIKEEIPNAQETDNISFSAGSDYKTEDPEICTTYRDLLRVVQAEMIEAGVKASCAEGVAALLYAAYVNRIPILLAGPNAFEIAEAFSVSVNCRIPAVLDCRGDFSSRTINACLDSNDEIFVFKNPFQNEWRNAVLDLLSLRNHFYIAVCPFAEDLVIEPRGTYNYFVPVLTELIVDEIPTRKYLGGILSTEYVPYSCDKSIQQYDSVLRSIRAGTIACRNIRKLSASIAQISADANDSAYRLLLYPLAYVLGEIPALSNSVTLTEKKPSKQLQDELTLLVGERNESVF